MYMYREISGEDHQLEIRVIPPGGIPSGWTKAPKEFSTGHVFYKDGDTLVHELPVAEKEKLDKEIEAEQKIFQKQRELAIKELEKEGEL